MTVNKLHNWAVSSYNENTECQFDLYINERQCNVGDTAYMYCHEDGSLTELKIAHIVSRLDNTKLYDNAVMCDDILIDGEAMLCADASAEFITDNDCYLVWFYCV